MYMNLDYGIVHVIAAGIGGVKPTSWQECMEHSLWAQRVISAEVFHVDTDYYQAQKQRLVWLAQALRDAAFVLEEGHDCTSLLEYMRGVSANLLDYVDQVANNVNPRLYCESYACTNEVDFTVTHYPELVAGGTSEIASESYRLCRTCLPACEAGLEDAPGRLEIKSLR